MAQPLASIINKTGAKVQMFCETRQCFHEKVAMQLHISSQGYPKEMVNSTQGVGILIQAV